MWQGLQTITDYKKKTSHGQQHLASRQTKHLLCSFGDNTVPPMQPATNVSKTFKHVNPRNADGPDGTPTLVLRACADQLAGVFMDMFNLSLSQSAAPTCFKMTTIVPVPKKAKVTELNDYRPRALTSVIM
jgi:hypothetical protein